MSAEQQKKVEAVQKQNEKIKDLNAKLAQAKELEAAGNYDQAITLLQQTTQTEPTQDLLWAYLGDAQRGAKKYTDAVDSYQKALAIKPNYRFLPQRPGRRLRQVGTDRQGGAGIRCRRTG